MENEIAQMRARTVTVVMAFLVYNRVSVGDMATLISSVYDALSHLGAAPSAPVLNRDFSPATTIRKSLSNPNHIISMIDGKPYKLMRRHLAVNGLTPHEYRIRYNLPADYPMTARAYSETRSMLARRSGLGRTPVKPNG